MRGLFLWSHDYYTSFFSFASYWSYATRIVINLQKTNKKFICEFPVIFLKVMVHSDLGSVQKLRPHLVDTTYQCFGIFKCFPLLVEKILMLHYLKLGLKLIVFQIVGLYHDKFKDQSKSSYSLLLWNQISY